MGPPVSLETDLLVCLSKHSGQAQSPRLYLETMACPLDFKGHPVRPRSVELPQAPPEQQVSGGCGGAGFLSWQKVSGPCPPLRSTEALAGGGKGPRRLLGVGCCGQGHQPAGPGVSG